MGHLVQNYPLLCNSYKTLVQPSGLINIGVKDNKYIFISSTDTTKEYVAKSEFADFNSIDLSINNSVDMRGLVVYEDYL